MLDEMPSVIAGPENQYVSVSRHCPFYLTPVDHVENP